MLSEMQLSSTSAPDINSAVHGSAYTNRSQSVNTLKASDCVCHGPAGDVDDDQLDDDLETADIICSTPEKFGQLLVHQHLPMQHASGLRVLCDQMIDASTMTAACQWSVTSIILLQPCEGLCGHRHHLNLPSGKYAALSGQQW